MSLQSEFPVEYAAAKHLIENGVPLFLAKRADEFPLGGSDGKMGYHLPSGWQYSKPDLKVLDKWKSTDALCAVMGHTVDALDIDPRNGGVVLDSSIMPTSYGRQSTPSGGTHDLIASLGIRSKDGAFPGVDVKAGRDDERGRGFIFLAPTEKRDKSKGTDSTETARYKWIEEPDLDMLAMVGRDDSGEALKAALSTVDSSQAVGYTGPDFDHLPKRLQESARDYQEAVLFDWQARLAIAANWPEGETDERGRGWEALARDFQWVVVCMAVCPWQPLTEAEAEDTFITIMPEVMLADKACQKHFYEGVFDRAYAVPANRPPWWAEGIFDQTEILQTIRDISFSYGRNPSGVLGCLLGRVLMEIPASTMLPPLSGNPAALNLGIAVVGGPSDGKSTSFGLSARVLGFMGEDQRQALDVGIGSGEGLIDMFLEPEKAENDKGKMVSTGKSILKDDPRAVFVCDEVDELEALGAGRAGSTLTSNIRKALTGDLLSNANTTSGGKFRKVPAGVYRTVVMLGIQPARSEVILREVNVGTPQRFLWVNASRSGVPGPEDRPETPEMLDWAPPTEWPEFIDYPKSIKDEIIRRSDETSHDWMITESRGYMAEVRESLESRQDLTRLKVSAALAVLHGETSITDQWWSIAGVLMEQSIEIQMACIKKNSAEQARAQTAKAVSMLTSQAEAGGIVTENRLDTCVDKIVSALKRKPDDAHTWDSIKPHSRYRSGLETDDIIETLTNHPNVEVVDVETAGRKSRKYQFKED